MNKILVAILVVTIFFLDAQSSFAQKGSHSSGGSYKSHNSYDYSLPKSTNKANNSYDYSLPKSTNKANNSYNYSFPKSTSKTYDYYDYTFPNSTNKSANSYIVPTYEFGGTRYKIGESYKSSGLPKVDRSSSAKKEFLKEQGYSKTPEGYQIDHIIPLFKGGSDNTFNMQLLPVEVHKQKTANERKTK